LTNQKEIVIFMIHYNLRSGIMKKIKITGMSCNHCVMAVTKALKGIEGIEDVSVDLKAGEATFEETKSVDPEVIKQKISEAGFEVVG